MNWFQRLFTTIDEASTPTVSAELLSKPPTEDQLIRLVRPSKTMHKYMHGKTNRTCS